MTFEQQHRVWRWDVRQIVTEIEQGWNVDCITYIDHPWPGWDGQSFDVWRNAPLWLPADAATLRGIRRYIHNRPSGPLLRHTILGRRLWTSFGGYSRWHLPDHSGGRRHLHATYW